jgi:hypothetical protein
MLLNGVKLECLSLEWHLPKSYVFILTRVRTYTFGAFLSDQLYGLVLNGLAGNIRLEELMCPTVATTLAISICKMTLNIRILSIMPLKIATFSTTVKKCDIQHK